FTASSLCCFSKEPRHRKDPVDGVSTYLALTFGTLLSSQGTDASFVLTLAGFPPGFPSVFPTLPDPFSVPFPVRIRFGGQLEGLTYSVA
ncbi:hypothetical protein, partial [Streptomyces yerevanensis]|uniref:hypothetical protein n=1 Tax=Streptomyces yerevanensis TaxID=66378 RepID=UPI001B80CA0D